MAKGAKDPAFPLYARDWLTSRSVRMLPRNLRSVLVDLWCLQWLDGPLPDNVEWLADEVRATTREVELVLSEFFDRTPRGFLSARMEAERERRQDAIRKASERGRRGAEARYGKRPADAQAPAQADAQAEPKHLHKQQTTHGSQSQSHTHTQTLRVPSCGDDDDGAGDSQVRPEWLRGVPTGVRKRGTA